MKFTKEKLEEVENQLSKPEGSYDAEMGENISKSNKTMTISALELISSDIILEIGHGNGAHVIDIINLCDKVKYYGLEISAIMKRESEKINQDYITSDITEFHLFNGNSISFSDNSL